MSATMTQLMGTITHRRSHPSKDSYTSALLEAGAEAIGKKVLEEAGEYVAAAQAANVAKGSEHLVYEAADLVYHLCVLLAFHHRSWEDVELELKRRFGVSGLAEKASRGESAEGRK